MLILVTKKPAALRKAIIDSIDNGAIDTWSYTSHPNNVIRFDWIGGVNNWPNLDNSVYFTATIHHPRGSDNYLKFRLHTMKGHYLADSDFARMHAELSYMLLTHFATQYEICVVRPTKMRRHHSDIIDD